MTESLRQQAAGVLRPAVTGFQQLFLRLGRPLRWFCADRQLSGNGVDADLILFTILLPA